MSALDSITSRIPLMRPGRTARNVGVVIVALVGLLFLPVTMLLIALAVPLLLAFNIRGLRDRLSTSSLSRLPGLSHERRIILVVAAFVYLLVLAGAASAVWSGFAPAVNNTTADNGTATAVATPTVTPTPVPTETPTETSTPTATPTATAKQSNASSGSGGGQATPYPNQTLIKNLSVVNERDSDNDGRAEAFALRVRANTTLPAADADGSAGDPYFAVAVGGNWKFDTPDVRRAPNGTFTIRMNESRLSSASPGRVWVRVRLMNRNTLFHDRIATRKVNVPYAPASTPTPTATPTDTPTPTPTDTPTPTPEPTDTETPTPTPDQSDASSGGSGDGSTGGDSGSSDSSDGDARGPDEGSEWTVTVTEIVDGDTVKVRFPNGDEENVRLLGVDTPEVSGGVSPDEFEGIPENDAGEEHLSEWADRASGFAADQLSTGEKIRIETDPSADRRGSYGRLLVYAYHDDGQLFNRQLLKDGYARLYESEFSKSGEFTDLESDAQSGNVGLWDFEDSDTLTPTPVPDGGDRSGELTIANIQPEGDDETVTLENPTGPTIDLSGYTVVFDDDQTYGIQGITLEAGETLTVHTGEGSDSDGNVYAGFGRSVLNDDGDTISIQDSSGTTVAEESYGDGG